MRDLAIIGAGPAGMACAVAAAELALLAIDEQDEFVLYYGSEEDVGRYQAHANVTERVVKAKGKLLWDQWAVPRIAVREGIDVLFNLKLSVPLFSKIPSAFVLHGPEQFVVPSAYKLLDLIQSRIFMPRYLRKASAVIVSTQDARKQVLSRIADIPESLHVVPASYSKEFEVKPQEELDAVRARYDLPDRFILFVGGLHPIKNIGRILRSLHLLRESWGDELPPLVIVGFKRWKVDGELALIDELGLGDKVLFPGFIPDADLPAFYNLATLFLFPSLYEGFGIPVLEAMACGCPVVTSKAGAGPEVGGDAALFADPYDPREIADRVNDLLKNEALRRSLSEKGIERALDFDWRNTAAATLSLLLHVVRAKGGEEEPTP